MKVIRLTYRAEHAVSLIQSPCETNVQGKLAFRMAAVLIDDQKREEEEESEGWKLIPR